MAFCEKIGNDLEHGIAEGMEMAKEGAAYVKKKAEKLTEETKKRLDLFELKMQVKREMTELGGRVYDLRNGVGSPLLDSSVKPITERIENLEGRITALERKEGETVGNIGTERNEGEIKEKRPWRDVEEAFLRALEAGAETRMPVQDMFRGDRVGTVKDPFGYSWSLATHTKDLTQREIEEGAEAAFAKMAMK
jgi:chaperonin cofactor prefoldin